MSKSSQEKPSWQKSKYWTYNTTNLSYHFKCVQRSKESHVLKKKTKGKHENGVSSNKEYQ